METELFHYKEYNDLSRQGLIYSNEESEYTKTSTSSSSASSSMASSAGATLGSIGAVAGVITAVAVIFFTVTVLSTIILVPPAVNLSAWLTTPQSIEFVIDTEESPNPYIISVLFEEQNILTKNVASGTNTVVFDGLAQGTDYEIIVENDFGYGIMTLIRFSVATQSDTADKHAEIVIDTHHVDYANKSLTLKVIMKTLDIFSNEIEIVVTDKSGNTVSLICNINENDIQLDISTLSRGFLSVEISALTQPDVSLSKIIYTKYKIVY